MAWPRPQVLFRETPINTTEIPGPGERITVPTEFVARWVRIPNVGTVEATLETQHGRSRVTQLVITEPTGRGITGIAMGDISVAEIRESALVASTFTIIGADGRERIRATGRRRIDDERLASVRDAFNAGGIEAVKTSANVGDRQAWRLKARAFAQHEGEAQ